MLAVARERKGEGRFIGTQSGKTKKQKSSTHDQDTPICRAVAQAGHVAPGHGELDFCSLGGGGGERGKRASHGSTKKERGESGAG